MRLECAARARPAASNKVDPHKLHATGRTGLVYPTVLSIHLYQLQSHSLFFRHLPSPPAGSVSVLPSFQKQCIYLPLHGNITKQHLLYFHRPSNHFKIYGFTTSLSPVVGKKSVERLKKHLHS